MSTTAAQSLKYWHDRTIHTPGWKRLLPLAGLLAVAVALLVKLAYTFLSQCIRPLLQRLINEAELARNQANETPPLKASEHNFTWVLEAIADGVTKNRELNDDESEHHCTCISNGNGGVYCTVHGNMYT